MNNNTQWMTTFADLMFLLLTFFALKLSAMSTPETLGMDTNTKTTSTYEVTQKDTTQREANPQLARIIVTRNNFQNTNLIPNTDKGIIQTINNATGLYTFSIPIGGFTENSAELSFNAEELVSIVAKITKHSDFAIDIKTYVSDIEIENLNFAPSWTLAENRAAHIVRQLIDTGVDPHVITAQGIAPKTQPNPRFPNNNSDSERPCLLVVLTPFDTAKSLRNEDSHTLFSDGATLKTKDTQHISLES